MSGNIWKEAVEHTRQKSTILSSFGAMKDCIRKDDVHTLAHILSHIHSSKKLDENTYQELMQTAAKSGALACFECLEPYVAEESVYSDALNSAAEKGYLDMVKHISPLVGEYAQEEALCMAVLYNRVDVVDYLLPRCNPKNQSSKFLAAAAAEGHTELFELLYPLSDPENALIYLKRKFGHQPESWEALEQRIVREKLLAATPQDRTKKRSKI